DFSCSGLGWNYRPGGDAERLRLLLAAGSPLSVAGEAGARVVGGGAARGDAERLAILLAHGASPHAWDDAGDRARMGAQFRKMAEERAGIPDGIRKAMQQAASMVERMGPPSGPFDFLIPLFCAVDGDSLACVRLLLEAGADVRQHDSQERTALWKARSGPMRRFLLERGLGIEERDVYEWPPLTDAVMDGLDALPRLRALLACGADPNATHDRGYTVFMNAAASMERHTDVLRALVEAGADPHAVSDLGY